MANRRNTITTDIQVINENLTRQLNVILLFIHCGLLLTFIIIEAPIMIFMNIISIIIYFYLFRVIEKNLVLYLLAIYVEILVHMTVASLCLGWKCGFQLYFFAFIPIIFYCDYISKKRKIMKIYPAPMSIIVIAVFLILRAYAYGDYAIYTHLSDTACAVMYMINIVMTFAFLMLFMAMFERMSLRNEERLQHMAEYDLLTNLSNRHRMTGIFNNLLEQNTEFSVAILDIDNFKKVNDTYGHNVGDKTLKAFAGVLSEVETDNIHVSRWGGEEFLVVLTGENTYKRAYSLLEQIRIDTSNIRIPIDSGELAITVSCGIAKWHHGERAGKTINRADSYLYIAKNSGKNQVIANDNEEPS